MFDLITGKTEHAPRPHAGPVLASIVLHAVLIVGVLVATFWFVAPPVPRDQIMMAFVAPAPPPPPPPPPAPPRPEAARQRDTPVPTSGDVAPVTEPSQVEPEPEPVEFEDGEERGVPGGVIGGLMPDLPPPPPPPAPPPPAAPRTPLRVGGHIKEPTLLHRVDPEYPALAVASKMEGLVILEAIVDEEGRVESVRSLRRSTIFDDAAIKAVRQWRYSPVLLNGRPEKFILTVVVSFNLSD
jgi:protein TonB